MPEGENQQGEKFKAGFGTWFRMVLVGIVCAVVLPIAPLLAVATSCGIGLLCFLVDHSLWVAGISAAIGFIGGMFLTFKLAQHSHKKRFEDQPFRPETLGDRRTEMMVERRKADARIAWLSKLGQERDRSDRR